MIRSVVLPNIGCMLLDGKPLDYGTAAQIILEMNKTKWGED